MKRIIYDYEKPHIVGRARGSFPLAKVIAVALAISLAVILIYILFFKETSSLIKAEEYFAVTVRTEGQAEAASVAEQIRLKGGGGYIDGSSVYVAVYPTKEDATTVASRYGYEVESLGAFTIKIKYGSKDINKKIANLCILPQELFDNIYSTSVSLDSKELSEAAALYVLDSLAKKVNDKKDELEKLKGIYGSDKLLSKVGLSYDSLISALKKESSYSAQVRLKYCLIEVAFIYKNLLNSLS